MPDTNTQPAVPFSEDVQDILHVAKKVAGKTQPLHDRYVLLGALQIARLFTRIDALLKHAGSSPKALRRLYQEEQASFPSESATLEFVSVMERAKALACKQATGEKPRVEIEHVMLALTESADPLVQSVFQKAGLTQHALMAALPKVKQESPVRFALYCIREVIEVVVVVLFLVVVIKQGLGELRLIPSESMLPTLEIGDRIVVEKVSHWSRKPQRGDVLVFYPPEPQSFLHYDPWSVFLRLTGFSGILYSKESKIDTAFIKRVVGLPGDVVEVRPGEGVLVNGRLLNEPYTAEVASTCTFINYCGPVKVPPHSYYMMGDNRNHSADSRFWNFLPEERIIGRAVFRFFPFDKRMGVITLPSPSQSASEDEIRH